MDTRHAQPPPVDIPKSPWLRPSEAAVYGKISRRLLYNEVRAGRLKAARVGGRRELRLKAEFIDQWLEATMAAQEPR